MSEFLPIIEQLADAATHGERADWLSRCPLGVIHREQVHIRVILNHRRFPEGVAYLDALLSLTNATRLPDGSSPPTVLMPVHMARIQMMEAARAVEGAKC